MNTLTYALIFLFCSLAGAVPQRYELFSKAGDFAPNYEILIEQGKLQPGDTIVFSNGKSFVFQRFLGRGSTTALLDIGEGKALRVPLHTRNLKDPLALEPQSVRSYINRFLSGYESLENTEVPSVKVFPKESLSGQYVTVENLEVAYTLEDFLLKRAKAANLNRGERKAAEDALVEFGARTWQFTYLGDFHPGQLALVDGHWKLLDWIEGMHRWKTDEDRGSENPFWWMGGEMMLPEEISRRVSARVESMRKKHLASLTETKKSRAAACPGLKAIAGAEGAASGK